MIYREIPRKGFWLLVAVTAIIVGLFIYRGVSRGAMQASSKQSQRVLGDVVAQASEAKKVRVGIQAGHWKAEELPDELVKLSWNFGASSHGVNEVDISLRYANLIAEELRAHDILVDILPATVPHNYMADAFISLHADGNAEEYVSGYKTAASVWSTDGRSNALSLAVQSTYGKASGLRLDPSTNDNMTEYYAFNYGKFYSSISPETPGMLLELGFVTNASDRKLLVNHSSELSKSIAAGILNYLEQEAQTIRR